MTLTAFLPVLVFVVGLIVYFVCGGLTKGSVAEIAKIAFFCGLFAFLLGAGSQNCSMSAVGGGGSAQHR